MKCNRYRVVRVLEQTTVGEWFDVQYLHIYMRNSIKYTANLECGYYTVECEHVEDAIKMIEEACNESH
jgi:hypothetical protein